MPAFGKNVSFNTKQLRRSVVTSGSKDGTRTSRRSIIKYTSQVTQKNPIQQIAAQGSDTSSSDEEDDDEVFHSNIVSQRVAASRKSLTPRASVMNARNPAKGVGVTRASIARASIVKQKSVKARPSIIQKKRNSKFQDTVHELDPAREGAPQSASLIDTGNKRDPPLKVLKSIVQRAPKTFDEAASLTATVVDEAADYIQTLKQLRGVPMHLMKEAKTALAKCALFMLEKFTTEFAQHELGTKNIEQFSQMLNISKRMGAPEKALAGAKKTLAEWRHARAACIDDIVYSEVSGKASKNLKGKSWDIKHWDEQLNKKGKGKGKGTALQTVHEKMAREPNASQMLVPKESKEEMSEDGDVFKVLMMENNNLQREIDRVYAKLATRMAVSEESEGIPESERPSQKPKKGKDTKVSPEPLSAESVKTWQDFFEYFDKDVAPVVAQATQTEQEHRLHWNAGSSMSLNQFSKPERSSPLWLYQVKPKQHMQKGSSMPALNATNECGIDEALPAPSTLQTCTGTDLESDAQNEAGTKSANLSLDHAPKKSSSAPRASLLSCNVVQPLAFRKSVVSPVSDAQNAGKSVAAAESCESHGNETGKAQDISVDDQVSVEDEAQEDGTLSSKVLILQQEVPVTAPCSISWAIRKYTPGKIHLDDDEEKAAAEAAAAAAEAAKAAEEAAAKAAAEAAAAAKAEAEAALAAETAKREAEKKALVKAAKEKLQAMVNEAGEQGNVSVQDILAALHEAKESDVPLLYVRRARRLLDHIVTPGLAKEKLAKALNFARDAALSSDGSSMSAAADQLAMALKATEACGVRGDHVGKAGNLRDQLLNEDKDRRQLNDLLETHSVMDSELKAWRERVTSLQEAGKYNGAWIKGACQRVEAALAQKKKWKVNHGVVLQGLEDSRLLLKSPSANSKG
eukprot:gnl/MRDRNA2_/MRDRNA2_122813_c0_seq1.p1 gnl/MRDRNA2_/MRDRNA2_122813_c0~~gnl/MRDRNA2_/MRDRNA2_122813_c0_seq1.p1  ORF type:complete len:914 (-),score=249.45 gnl/MRDRNA2_/MRDRNA2_122813_c0_seq1:197-2938(-)